jgi:molybdate transport system substrate-binding protein
MRAVIESLGPEFESKTGYKLAVNFTTSGGLLKRMEGGETADVVIMPQQGIARLIERGNIEAKNVNIIAESKIGVAVRQGASQPDISSTEALRQALLAARSITYPNPAHGAASGIHFAKVLDRLGIANAVQGKTIFLPSAGPVGMLVAKGEAEIAVHQIQELIPVAGIEIIGPLPDSVQDTLVFAGAIVNGTRSPDVSRKLIDFLRSPASSALIKGKGMDPR